MSEREPPRADAAHPWGAGGVSGEPRTPGALRVMSYNIHGGRDPKNQLDLKAVAEVIRREAPDLAALQEVHQRLPQTRCQPQAALLKRWTGRVALFVPSLGFSLCGYGNALLSPQKAHRWQRHLLPSMSEQRCAVEARFPFAGRTLRILATHLGLCAAERHEQIVRLASLTSKDRDAPLLVLGDLNEPPDSPLLAPLYDLGLRHALPPDTPTFPSTAPTHHIDYVLVDEAWDVVAARAPQSLASDHLPVVADLILR